jgi:hypothetical protein
VSDVYRAQVDSFDDKSLQPSLQVRKEPRSQQRLGEDG